eukprot:PhM_4_TR9206/c0_g1_i1/m.9199/K04886/KCNB2; potassium voltage-gated channel Shab-related subfamily B member 2
MDSRRAEIRADYLRYALSQHADVFDEELFVLCREYTTRHEPSFSSLQSAKDRLEMSRDELLLLPLRDRMAHVLEDPLASRLGRVLLAMQTLLVLIFIIAFIMETVPAYNPRVFSKYSDAYNILEIVLTVYFTVEAIVRVVVSRDRIRWFKQWANLFDILSVLPFYLSLMVDSSSDDSLVVFKILRLARVVKLFRNVDAVNNLVKALERSARALLAPILFLLTTVAFFSSLIYYVEKGDFDEGKGDFFVEDYACTATAGYHLDRVQCPKVRSKFTSIPATLWWGVVTMSTVGYGDLVPQTPLGKVFASACMMCGVLFIAMPIAVVGSYFTEVNHDYEKQRVRVKEIVALRLKEDRKRVEEYARQHQLHAIETGELRAFCSGRQLKHCGTRDDMIDVIYEHLGLGEERDLGIDARTVPPGEALIEHLRTFVPDDIKLSDFDAVLVHHLDVFIYRLCATLLRKVAAWSPAPQRYTNPCRLHLIEPVETLNNTLYLSHPVILSVGRRTAGLPDPDIVLPVDTYEATGVGEYVNVSQRHATITMECTPKAWRARIRPGASCALHVNGVAVDGTSSKGVWLQHGDVVDFCPNGPSPLRFRFECDEFDLTVVRNALTACFNLNANKRLVSATAKTAAASVETEMQPVLPLAEQQQPSNNSYYSANTNKNKVMAVQRSAFHPTPSERCEWLSPSSPKS